MEEKAFHPEQAEFAGDPAKIVGLFLHGVADIDEGPQRPLATFGADMAQDPSDLGLAALTSIFAIAAPSPAPSRMKAEARHSLKPRK